jgi:hypothetical protein
MFSYRTPMYFDNKDSYSSWLGGLVTIMIILFLSAVFLTKIMPILSMKTFIKTEKNKPIVY